MAMLASPKIFLSGPRLSASISPGYDGVNRSGVAFARRDAFSFARLRSCKSSTKKREILVTIKARGTHHMANIALVGMTGNIGSRILNEALARGHRVTGTTRGMADLPARDGVTVATVHPADAAALAAVLRGHDVVVVSLKWDVNDIDAAIEAIRQSGVRRALIVVGAGSLRRADGRLHFDHMPTPSPSSKPAMVALEKLRQVDDFDWPALSPPTSIKPRQ